jgi:outer membrane receptor for monomeric catechols
MTSKFFLMLAGCISLAVMAGNTLLPQHQDSLKLEIEKLDWEDIKPDEMLSTTTKVISGSRSEKDIEELPFTVYVIEAEEIRKNGYLTLTDVLRRLPGIRVSQPGSALEATVYTQVITIFWTTFHVFFVPASLSIRLFQIVQAPA